MEHEFAISHLRDCLGVAYLHVARTDEPVIVRRYARADVALGMRWLYNCGRGAKRAAPTENPPTTVEVSGVRREVES